MCSNSRTGGRRALDRSLFTKVCVDSVEEVCLLCASPLWVSQHASRPLQTLAESWSFQGKGQRCSNPDCPGSKQGYPPWRSWSQGHLVVKGSGYGLDVLCHIGRAYFTRTMSMPDIHRELANKYGLQISERHVSNLFKLFLALVEGRNLDNKRILDQLKQQGGIILSADGVFFDETSPVLFVMRDVLSDEILYVERLDSAEGVLTELLSKMFAKVKACGLPVLGIITDKESSLVAAAREIFPDVPHQFCQAHYLKNLGIPLEAGLSDIGKCVRSVVKESKQAERAFKDAEATEDERHLARELCRVVQIGGKTRGDNITNPTFLKRYQRLRKVAQVIENACQKPGSWPLLNKLKGILSKLESSGELALLLQEQVKAIREIAHILKEGGESGHQVAEKLRGYLDSLHDRAPSEDLRWPCFVNGADRLSERYWKGLFHCYDNPNIPATNNGTESLFGTVKRQQRKVTGRSSTSGGPIETCAAFVLGAWNLVKTHPELVPLLQDLEEADLNRARARLEKLAQPAKQKRSVARNPDSYLEKLLSGWSKLETG